MRGSAKLLAALCLSAAALGVTACGGDDSGEGPASAVPADAPVYIETVVNLEDADGLTDALETIGVEDAAEMLNAELDAELESSGAPVSWSDDLEPLLGERGGLFLQNFGSGDAIADTTECIAPDGVSTGTTDDGCALPTEDDTLEEAEGAFMVETTDEDDARSTIDELLADSGDPVEDASHEGVDYKLNPEDGDAVAVFDGLVVLGTESGIQAAIDASDGDSLADNDEFRSEVDAADADPVFTFYADPGGVLDQLETSGEVDPAERAVVEEAAGGLLDVPAVVTVGAESDRITVDASVGVSDSAAQLPVEESTLLRELPGDSWAATAVPDVGASIQQALDQVSATIGSAAPDFDAELRRETGFDLAGLTGAIGDVALFARGTSPLDAGGGLVVEDLDSTATADAVETLRRLALREAGPGERVTQPTVEGEGFSVSSPDLPQPVNVIQRDGKLVIAYGDAATEDALAPSETLGDSDTFGTAEEALGDYDVALFVDGGPALDLAESAGATSDPGYADAAPYLDHFDYLITGGTADDDRSRTRLVLGLAE